MNKLIVVLSFVFFANASFAESGIVVEFLTGHAQQKTTANFSGSYFGEPLDDKFQESGGSFSYGIRAAYQLGDNFALELAHLEYGESDYRYVDDFGDLNHDKLSSYSSNIGIKGMLPFSNGFSLNGRIGAGKWDLNVQSTDSSSPGGTSESGLDGWDVYYSIGSEYRFSNMFVGVEYAIQNMKWDITNTIEEGSARVKAKHKVSNFAFAFGVKF